MLWQSPWVRSSLLSGGESTKNKHSAALHNEEGCTAVPSDSDYRAFCHILRLKLSHFMLKFYSF